jgi:hypothetical protein
MRRLRYVIDRVVIYVGVSLILGAMLFSAASVMVTLFVLIGLLLVQLGVWRGASTMLPSVRTNQGLRDQVDLFIELVREIYTVANAKNVTGFATTADKLRARTEGVIDAARVDLS